MSAICHGFVQNAWRKDICSNCFRVRDEHSQTGINNSVKCNGTTSTNSNNGVNISTIVPNTSNNNHNNPNHGIKAGNESNVIGASDFAIQGKTQSPPQKLQRFQGGYSSNPAVNSVGVTIPTAFGGQGSSSGIPRIHSGSTTTVTTIGIGNGKFPGNNCSTTTVTLSKGHTVHSARGNKANSETESNVTLALSETKVKSTEATLTKAASPLSSTNAPSQPQIQGKGVMTNQHPSKCDNSGVIPNHNNNNKPATSSSSQSATARNTCASSASTSSSSSSSFIASKNIFNNATAPASTVVSTLTGFSPATGSSSSTTGCCIVSINGSTVASCSSGAGTTATSGSSGLSHSQSATSIKRGSINNFSSSSSSSATTVNQQSLQKSCVVDVISNSGSSGGGGGSHKNLEIFAKNGHIENKWELSEGVSNASSAGVVISVNKGAMNKGRGVKPMDAVDGDATDRKKVEFSSASAATSGDKVTNVKVGDVRLVTASHKKGILRRKKGSGKKEKNVRFPDEVVQVIGYGGGPSGSDDEDDTPVDPMDSASVAEVLEKSSTTVEEKELCRITQKNTNFNSIKTNLLGTTCIEIGPIVGCTGGKSMEGSSKPLVSIGTFETRKEPLRIHKKISEDSADDELNEKTVETHRKFIQRGSNNSSSATTNVTITGRNLASQVPNKTASMPSSSQSSKEFESKQQHAITQSSSSSSSSVVSTAKSILSASNNNNKTTSSSFNSSVTSTLNKTSISTNKTSSSISNKSAAPTLSLDKGSGSSTFSTTTIEVNPERTSSSSSTNNAIRSSKECVATISTSEIRSKSSISQGATTVTTNRIISSNTSSSSSSSSNPSTSSNKWNNNSGSSVGSNNDGNPLRNKPVLKRIQQQQQKTTLSDSEAYTVNAAVVETQKISSVTSSTSTVNSRGNLIILTNGDKGKVNSSNIANKRTSFLRDIIVDSSSSSSTSSTIGGTTGGIELHEPSGSTAGTAVQVICKNNEDDSLMKTELKVDLKPSVNNGKLSHPPFGECLSNRSNGTDDSSEFDDSLEDSGLDIKKCSEISESDEKSGSGSDSGNENDYSDRDRVKIIPAGGPKSGLFISVEEVEGTSKKPEKLSPDSVLFSSASEMSASGSSESIPEALHIVSNDDSAQKVGEATGESSGNNGNVAMGGPTVKRTAPPPPPPSNPPVDSSSGSNAIYANSQQASIVEVDGIYDDVSFYKNPMHFPLKNGEKVSAFEEEEEEEDIYDDCNTITAIPKGGLKSGGKSAVGSYNFQNGSHNALDSDGDEEAEKVVHRRSDGIEFIGIRKIDSESFLRERSPSPEKNPDGKRERSSSASPKTRRKVNQFFSTIGKRAGAAFSQHVHGYSSRSKGNAVIEESVIEKSPSGNSSAYKRSHSTDEVSMTRTQEIYATLTPTSLKFKGLAPVLHKLSKIDLNLGDKDRDFDDDKESKKKHKISSSIKKFLRFGSKDGGESSGNKYDFGNSQNKTEMSKSGQMITSQISEESLTDTSASRTPTPTTAIAMAPGPSVNGHGKLPERKPSCGTMSGRPPPPPPPRVHSLDLLNRVGVAGPNGTVRPARPPPPARHNRVAPSFTSVFTNPNAESETKTNGTNHEGPSASNGGSALHHYSTANGDTPDPNNPPSKPRRKASMNLDCVTNGISQRDLETTYNHITTLNLETLKLIASQSPTKIRRSTNFSRRSSSHPLKWSQFHVSDPSKPLSQGHGFVFYTALLDEEPCVLLIQESVAAPHFAAPFEFPCVETSATFEDFIPDSYITWPPSEYVKCGSNVKAFVSVMPKYNMYTVENYMHHSQVPLLHKYFALLQAMNYWDKEKMSDLLVLVQSTEELDHFPSNHLSSPSSVLVYVHPIPQLSKPGGKRYSSQLCSDFENSMKQILLSSGSDGATPILGENDRQVLLKRLNENKTKTVQDQVRLFLQVKLFAPKRDSEELERIKKLRSERAIQQWIDRERALCMKEAVEQTLQRNIESSISPYKRSYLEFLLTPENSAKAVLDMLIDLLE